MGSGGPGSANSRSGASTSRTTTPSITSPSSYIARESDPPGNATGPNRVFLPRASQRFIAISKGHLTMGRCAFPLSSDARTRPTLSMVAPVFGSVNWPTTTMSPGLMAPIVT